MGKFDIIQFVIESIIALTGIIVSILINSKCNKVAKTNLLLEKANVEINIRNMITDARNQELTLLINVQSMSKKDAEHAQKAIIEQLLNAYDEACAKYIDNKVDKDRFKKMYMNEITKIVEKYKDKFDNITNYGSVLKVYKEFCPSDYN